ncbi:type VII secretion protein EccE [Mycobacterium sp. SMC-4]|uniref:type VII secretion protein EccE n=1 Tax=Mycobacterium sp. SMC-4 TaxID=2857059 RepID=UPI0021B4A7E5|nr:type VII secretion protein EccE [Mycobacterium sp. SMC-4]UXA18444.1 type VII secretion protein EccE [Mycobacterium sp. SMC-4]
MIVRLTLALLVAIPAAMAYPWETTASRWLLGAAVAVLLVLFAWWRGMFVTTMVARRIAMWRRRGRVDGSHRSTEFATVALRVTSREATQLPLAMLAGYVDRYGIAFDKVRITSRDAAGERTTWVSVTLGAADNLIALTARSPRIPLQDTVELTGRRLADQLREHGWEVAPDPEPMVVLPERVKESWRAVADSRGHVAAYRIAVGADLGDTLAALRVLEAAEVWSAVEITGSRTVPELAAACAVRTDERPGRAAPLPGLTPERGTHGPALTAMSPKSDERLSASRVGAAGLLDLGWFTGAVLSRT